MKAARSWRAGKGLKMPKDGWDKLEIFSKFLGALLVPILVGVVGFYTNNVIKDKDRSQKDKEISQRYIEIAVGILSAKPTSENQSLRDWSIQTINKYSEIKFSPAVIKVLKEKPLPKSPTVFKDEPVTVIRSGTPITDEKGNILTDEKGNPLVTE
jgi:hypothetical protein